jgi:hypothetical protein
MSSKRLMSSRCLATSAASSSCEFQSAAILLGKCNIQFTRCTKSFSILCPQSLIDLNQLGSLKRSSVERRETDVRHHMSQRTAVVGLCKRMRSHNNAIGNRYFPMASFRWELTREAHLIVAEVLPPALDQAQQSRLDFPANYGLTDVREAELNVVRFPARARLVLGERIRGVNSAATRGLINSQRLLLVSAFLAGERGAVCSFCHQHAIWRSALSAPCLYARITLLYGDGLFCHRLPNQPLRFLAHQFLRHRLLRHILKVLPIVG